MKGNMSFLQKKTHLSRVILWVIKIKGEKKSIFFFWKKSFHTDLSILLRIVNISSLSIIPSPLTSMFSTNDLSSEGLVVFKTPLLWWASVSIINTSSWSSCPESSLSYFLKILSIAFFNCFRVGFVLFCVYICVSIC